MMFTSDVQQTAIRVATRIVGPDHAEDIFQQACLKVLTTSARYRGDSAFKSWFHRIILNECFQKLRRDHTVSRDSRITVSLNGVDTPTLKSAETRLIDKERRMVLWQAVQGLSAGQRQAIVLAYYVYPGETVAFVANKMGLTVAALKSRLHHGRKELASHLTEENSARNNF